MLYPDIGVGPSIPLLSSTPIKRPNKRSRLELEEDPSGASSSMNVEEPMDSTYDPADSVTTLTEPTDVKWQGYLFVNVAISSVVLIFYYVMWNLEIIEVTLYYSNRFESSKPVHKTATYIVYENCLLQLFEQCPVCQRVTNVRRTVFGTFLFVEQRCPHCPHSIPFSDFFRKWNSQPIIQSTPAGNLQLSVAVYANGASFFKVKQVGWWGFYCLAYNLLL